MLKYALLPYLFLLAGVHCKIQQDFMDSFLRSPVPLSENYVIASEPSDDKHSFAVAHFEQNHRRPLRPQIQLYILNDWDSAESKGCYFDLHTRTIANRTGISALHRLANDKLVFTWYEELIDDLDEFFDRRYRINAVDMRRCALIDLGYKETEASPFVVPSSGESFDVLVKDVNTCKSLGDRCRVHYDLEEKNKLSVQQFNVAFDWTTMEVKRLGYDGLLVHGRVGDFFKVVRIHQGSNHGKPLIGRVDGQPNMQFVSSSDLSFCWNIDPSSSFKLNCVQYDQTAKDLSLNRQDVNLYQEMHLLYVRGIDKDEVIVVANKNYCNEESDNCWELLVTKVEQERKKDKWTRATFPCSGEQSKLVIFSAEKVEGTKSVKISYACRNGNGYSFSDIEV